jgi:hypothetical protein
MDTKILTKLKEVLKILSNNGNVSFKDNDLFTLSNSEILTPIGDIIPRLTIHRSKLKDQFIDTDLFIKLIDKLSKDKSIIRLDHIGFCYKVDSLAKEKDRLIELITGSKYHLYQEPSNDEALWLFMGNIKNWEEPVIELLPIEKTNDKWVDYWLPHIQLDIDTTLNGKEAESLVKSVCGNYIVPFAVTIENSICIVRNRLGTIDGVNITLDLATTARNVRSLREGIWKKIA